MAAGLNEAQIILISLGVFMEILGTGLVLSGRGGEASGANAMNRINLNVPAWLMVVILGCVMIFGSLAWNWTESNAGETEDPDLPIIQPDDDDQPDIPILTPWDFGDDAFFDILWNECAVGITDACDDLYAQTPLGSVYEDFAATCGWRLGAWDEGNCWSYSFFD